jgi:enamine deaminase RidA (YjgF/YER057c/UK114 family)
MIRAGRQDGTISSTIEADGVRHVFFVSQSDSRKKFPEQFAETLRSLDNICKERGALVLMQSVFLADCRDEAACRQIMRDSLDGDCRLFPDVVNCQSENAVPPGKRGLSPSRPRVVSPATSYIPQAPCTGGRFALEAWAIAPGDDAIEIERPTDDLAIARHGGMSWAFLAARHPATAELKKGTDSEPNEERPAENGSQPRACPLFQPASTYQHSLAGFQSAESQLCENGFHFNDVLRTWLYLGDITGAEGETLRYLELNRARTDFYRGRKFVEKLVPPGWRRPVFPASTGIGTHGRQMAIGCIALKTEREDVRVFPLENPQQTAAYDYAHQYGPDSPKFARAMAVVTGDSVQTFISGTASITASDTRHTDDLERQTQQTFDNIEVLISNDNFAQHGFPGMGATLADVALARVYLKHADDFARAQAICEKRLAGTPALYVVGDVCREELLVEIEAIAFRKKGSGVFFS